MISSIYPSFDDDPDEIARIAAAECFEWRNNAMDRDGEFHNIDDEEGEWVMISDQVIVYYGAIDGQGNEVGMAPTMTAKLEGEWANGNRSEIKVTLKMMSGDRINGVPRLTYFVSEWSED